MGGCLGHSSNHNTLASRVKVQAQLMCWLTNCYYLPDREENGDGEYQRLSMEQERGPRVTQLQKVGTIISDSQTEGSPC